MELLGSFTGSMQVGPTTLTSAGGTDVLIATLSTSSGGPL